MSSLIAREGVDPWKRRLFLPAYRVKEAARYARTSPQTVSYWHRGSGGAFVPVLPNRQKGNPLSYLELVEVAFVAVMRSLGVSLQRIRKAREYLAQSFRVEYPFAVYQFMTDGHHILMDLEEIEPIVGKGKLIVTDAQGQLAWKHILSDRFDEFDYESGLATRWHLAGRDKPITIDPRIAFGSPVIHGVQTWVLRGRWEAGERIEDITEEFEIEFSEVRQALEFEGLDPSVC